MRVFSPCSFVPGTLLLAGALLAGCDGGGTDPGPRDVVVTFRAFIVEADCDAGLRGEFRFSFAVEVLEQGAWRRVDGIEREATLQTGARLENLKTITFPETGVERLRVLLSVAEADGASLFDLDAERMLEYPVANANEQVEILERSVEAPDGPCAVVFQYYIQVL